MSLAVGDEEDSANESTQKTVDSKDSSSKVNDVSHSTPKIVPVSLHDASLQALLTSAPQLSPILSHSSKTVGSSSSSCHSQETSPTAIRHPFCIDRSIVVGAGPRRFTHKRNKSAPIWLHNASSVMMRTDSAAAADSFQRRNSFDQLYNHKVESPSLPIKFSSTASTDEGVWTCNESTSTPSTEPDKIDDTSLSSTVNSCDIDEAYNTDSSLECTGYPGLVSSSTWIEVQNEQADSNLVSVKVGSKSSHVVHFSVKAGDVITWEFATIKRDIGFGILFECSVVEEKKSEDGELLTDVDSITSGYGVIPILPIFKVKSNISPIFGSHEAVTDGVYVMTWDNSYSRFFAKDLFYRISTQTEIRSSEFPHGIITFQHGYTGCLEEIEESGGGGASSRFSSESSDANENTLCEEQERGVVVITQNNSSETATVYFDVSQHASSASIQDL